MARFHLLEFDHLPIFEQLQLEEALLRADQRNWCIVNHSSTPAIVMGISGKLHEIDRDKARQLNLPIIQRFSGGGTVVVDEDTLFITLLGNKSDLAIPCFPEPLMRYSAELFSKVHPEFGLQANDYTLGQLKVGGNAQYLRKNRWLHHTTFLWDYCPERMSSLHMPDKVPDYRQQREHGEFLTALKKHIPSKGTVTQALYSALRDEFELVPADHAEIDTLLRRPHRKATKVVMD